MTVLHNIPHPQTLLALLCALALAGCASVDLDDSVAKANQDAAAFTQGKLALVQTQAQRSARRGRCRGCRVSPTQFSWRW